MIYDYYMISRIIIKVVSSENMALVKEQTLINGQNRGPRE